MQVDKSIGEAVLHRHPQPILHHREVELREQWNGVGEENAIVYSVREVVG